MTELTCRRNSGAVCLTGAAIGSAYIRLKLFTKILCQIHSEWATTETSLMTIAIDYCKWTSWIRFFEAYDIVFISEISCFA